MFIWSLQCSRQSGCGMTIGAPSTDYSRESVANPVGSKLVVGREQYERDRWSEHPWR